ncbi:hypothetical protein BN136_1827 [Cronobacter universalis NCTC 9529]|nr:hypothetical protein BN136_1827 [Cronobacter universalis NCTC 9529]
MNGVSQIQVLKTSGVMDLPVDEQNVAQHREEVGLQRANDLPVDERLFRWINQLKLYAALAAQHVNIEIFKARQQRFAVIGLTAGIENRKRTVAKELIQVAAGGALKHVHFQLRQQIHRAQRANMCNQVSSLRGDKRRSL